MSKYEERAREWWMDPQFMNSDELIEDSEVISSLDSLLQSVAAEARREALEEAKMEILSECMNALGAKSPGTDVYNAGVSHCLRAIRSLPGAK